MQHTIKATTRTKRSGDQTRDDGKIPAVYYGKGTESMAIAVDKIEFEKLWEEAGESSVVTIDVEGKPVDTLIHEVQYHPVNGHIIHADFYVFDKNQKTEVSVPLVFVGEAPAEKAGLVVNRTLHELEVEALPMNLPHELEVSLEGIVDLGSVITAGDVPLPTGVTLVNDPEEVVISVAEEREEEPEEPVEEVDMDAIEVEKKGKEEGEESEEEGDEDSDTPDKKE